MAGLSNRLDRLERRAGLGGPKGWIEGVNKPPVEAFDYAGFAEDLVAVLDGVGLEELAPFEAEVIR